MVRQLKETVKNHYSRLFASLYRQFRDIDLVEDGLQDAFERALRRWADKAPTDPAAWLYTTARNRIIDAARKSGRIVGEVPERGSAAPEIVAFEEGRTLDEQLRLICLCCHPSLSERSQVLLTLKLVAGLTTEEIAAGLVMKPKSVGQALTRSKAKIKLAGIPFAIPDESHLNDRLEAIHKILYLVYNEGYHSNSEHSLYRVDLCREAIRLTRLLVALHQGHRETVALLCLMLFTHARARSRSTPDGQPVLLSDQNRLLWDREMISEAEGLYQDTVSAGPDSRAGPFAFQAAIAREHARAPRFDRSDWRRICGLYSELYLLRPDPIVLLAWLGAESYRSSPAQALKLMESHRLETHLEEYRWFYSTRGELRSRSGDETGARSDFEHALSLTRNPGERRFLEGRLRRLDGGGRR